MQRIVAIVVACLVSCLAAPEARAGATEQALITHYYQSLLKRAPDAGGLAFWDSEVTRMKALGQDARDAFLAMGIQFVDSPEYRSFNRNDSEYVGDLYLAFLHRGADPGGLSFWQSQIAQGMPRGVVMAQFLYSTEFDQYMAGQFGAPVARPEGTTVVDFYRGYLVRLPDNSGQGFWTWQFRAAQCAGGNALSGTADSISSLFQSSAEYAGRARSNADFVADLYIGFLRRGGDLAGVQYWVSQLNAGATRDSLRVAFLGSPEFQSRLAAISAADCYAPPLANRKDAARLLQQGTFGAPLVEISRVADLGASAWIDEQFATPATSFTAIAQANINANKLGANGCTGTNQAGGCPWQVGRPTFYKQAFEAPDQLRQRVVNALSQIVVVSLNHNRILDAGTGLPNYLDMLGTHAFGNYRTLLRDVTLHPAMGIYLDMLGSSLEVPNENYARELLQLFSIGTVMLNADGSVQRDGLGQTIPTYSEDTIKGFARAFTGWHFAGQDMTKSWKFYWPDEQWATPMQVWTGRRCPQDGRWPAGSTTTFCSLNDVNRSFPPPHDTGAKTLLQYPGAPFANVPAGQTPQADIESAIDNIFNHPNVGPFVGKQLIQRLVTSNPSPAYVARVTAAFNNNGSGVRGDMKAVIRAILLDVEARDAATAAGPNFGRLREPVWKFLHLHRAFNARNAGGYYDIWDTSDSGSLAQAPISAPSVFNFFDKDYSPSGVLGPAGLRGPEFELATASSVTGFADFTTWGVFNGFNNGDSAKWIKPNYDRYLVGANALADKPQQLVDELDLLLTAGNLKPAFKTALVTALNGVTRTLIDDQRRDRLRIAFWQIVHSSDYAVQR